MAENKVEFRIDLNGNVYTGVSKLDKSVTKLCTNTSKACELFDKVGNIAIGLNNIFQLTTTAIDKVAAGVGKIVDLGSENELQKMNMVTLFRGNAEAAEDMFNKISQYGKVTVYDKKGLLDAQKTMMSFGLTADLSFQTLKQIGDIAMGDAQKMQSLSLAFAQATSAGKLQGQDLMQLINAGFNPLQIISERTGVSLTKLKDDMSKGKISAEMLSQAFRWATDEQGLFYQGAEKAGITTVGRINQIKDTFSEFIIGAFDQLKPLIDQCLDFATNVVGKMPAMLDKVSNAVKNVVGFFREFKPVIFGAAAAVAILTATLKWQDMVLNILIAKEAVVTAATNLWAGAHALLNVVMTANPIGLIIAGIAALVGAIVWVSSKITGWGSLWDGICGFMKYSFYAFVDGVKLYFTTLINGIMAGLDIIKLGWYRFKEACGIGNSEENQAAIAQINADIEKRQQAIIDGAKAVQENALKANESLKGIEMGWKGKDETEKVQNSLGTNAAMRQAVNGSVNGATGRTGLSGSEKEKSATAVATGGTRKTDIHINLKSLVENMNFNGSTAENLQQIQTNIATALLQALNMAQASVS